MLHRHTVLQAELAICAGTLAGLYLSRMEVSPITRRRIAALDASYEDAAAAPVHWHGYTHYLPCVVLMTDLPGTDSRPSSGRGPREPFSSQLQAACFTSAPKACCCGAPTIAWGGVTSSASRRRRPLGVPCFVRTRGQRSADRQSI